MKKRLLSLLLAVCTALSLLVVPAGAAASRYSDVADQNTVTMAEVLRIMGVMDGYGDGTFRPNAQVNRAQFCKMATYAMNKQQQLGLYRTVTVFPDVKPSHWAASYINLAARTSMGGGQVGGAASGDGAATPTARPVISGYPDGKFHPERVVTMGQAVTILLRVLGYQDTEIGGVWPDSYMASGALAGLTKGLPTNGSAPLTRGQAVQLFVNLLEAKGPTGNTLYTLGKEVTLQSIDGGRAVMKLSDGTEVPMANAVTDSTLVGASGRVVMSGENALTFLPSHGTGTGSSAGAIVIYDTGSAAGLSALAGNNTYKLYKNGSPAGAGDLRRYDVATYYPSTNSILVTDTRVNVFYEDCEPNPKEPTSITILGTKFPVLPTAQSELSKFKPGDQMTVLLTADGRVAMAVKADSLQGNALGFVSTEGKVQMFCGGRVVDLNGAADKSMQGKVVRIASSRKDVLALTEAQGGFGGDLNADTGMLGSKRLADNVMIYENGKQIGLGQLNRELIPAEQVQYTRVNWAGDVDVVVLNRTAGEIFGVAVVEAATQEDGSPTQTVSVVNSSGSTAAIQTGYTVHNGEYVAAKISKDGDRFTQIAKLTCLSNVANTAWVGETLVHAGGRSYKVPSDVQCYNRSTKTWITLEKALSFGGTTNLHVKDGVVRIVEVG